jgi:hypothetical protein
MLARGAEDWRAEVSRKPAGAFAPLPSIRMHFTFGWSNVLEAAETELTIRRKGGDYRAVVNGRTKGVARTLWMLDAQHSATVAEKTLLPKRFAQFERYRRRTIQTQVLFDDQGLRRWREVIPSKEPPKWKRVDHVPVRDVIGAVLYVRSQPLKVGDEIGLVCFPGDSPYIAVVKVEKRETIRSMGRNRPALRLSLGVRKLEVEDRKLAAAVTYEKFKSGTVWVSDDGLRLPLRAEVNVFIGFVYGELTRYEML